MEESLIALEIRPDDDQLLNTIFRTCHTLKGDAASLGFPDLSEFAHVLEDVLVPLREGTEPLTPVLTTLLLETVDALREMVSRAVEGEPDRLPGHESLLQRIRASAADPNAASASDEAAEAATGPDEGAEDTLEHRARKFAHSPTLRIKTATLDRLLNFVGEIAISRSRLGQMLEGERAPDADRLREARHATDLLFADLQREVMRVRMVPVEPLFRQQLRTVREAALAQGKRAGLVIEGADAELDTSVMEHLRDPLTHMIRNAIAHGIEAPERREARGKDRNGRITLRAYHEGASIVVQVADDGAGLDRRRVRERALALGYVGEHDEPSDEQLHRVIFEPGFSTADEATLTSGRGVGLDVVRRNIEALRGSVSVDSVESVGTTVTIRLPLTLAIIDGFAVGVDEEVYLIPLHAVSECLDVPPDTARDARGSGLIHLRGSILPYVRLRDLLGTPWSASARESIVVIQHGDKTAGLAVDSLYGERQAVLKPLSRFFRDVPGIAGSTILGSGRVALVLDVPALLRARVGWQRPNGGAQEPPGAPAPPA